MIEKVVEYAMAAIVVAPILVMLAAFARRAWDILRGDE